MPDEVEVLMPLLRAGSALSALARAALAVVLLAALTIPARAAEPAPVPTVELAVMVVDETGLHVEQTEVAAAAAPAIAAQLERLPEVLEAEVDGVAYALAVDPLAAQQWSLNRLQAADSWQAAAPRHSATGQVVAVVDSGVDAAHPDLSGVVLPGRDLVGVGDGRTDPSGHGTHVAGTIAALAGNGQGIAGLAPGVRILPLRVLDSAGSGSFSDIAQGIIDATDRKASVINLSLGSDIPSDTIARAIDYANARGAVVVAAAGNDALNGNARFYPAAEPTVVAVGATTDTDTRASFSNTGDYVDLAAPGYGIVSTWRGGGYRSSNGTSMAAPQVSAVAALVRQYGCGIQREAVIDVLRATTVDLGPAGRDDSFGSGLVQPLAALQEVAAQSPTSALAARHATLGSGDMLGTPVGGETALPGGCGQAHQRGRSYWSQATGAREVHGFLLARYLELGGPPAIGFPVSDEVAVSGGRASYFTHGHLYWSRATGAQAVRGLILSKYRALGGPAGFLRLPLTDELAVPGGRASSFQNGRIYWSPASGAHEVHGEILRQYLALGGPSSRLGLPTSDERVVAGAPRSDFAHGSIQWSRRVALVSYR